MLSLSSYVRTSFFFDTSLLSPPPSFISSFFLPTHLFSPIPLPQSFTFSPPFSASNFFKVPADLDPNRTKQKSNGHGNMLEAKLETRARGAALKYILYIYFENSGKEGAGTGCPDKPRPAI